MVIIGWIILWQFGIEIELMVLSALLGVFISFYMPSAVPLIQSIVSKKHLVNANATIDMVYELATILGMGLSRVIFFYAGIKGTLLIGVIFFIIAGLFNFTTKVPKNKKISKSKPAKLVGKYIVSLHYFNQNLLLFIPSISQIIIKTLLMNIPVIFFPYTQEVLNANSRVFTIFEALYSLSIFTGALLSPLFCKVLSISKTLALLLAVMAMILSFCLSIQTLLLFFLFMS